MIIKLVAFADSTLKRSAERLKEQAVRSGYYDQIKVYSEKDLDKNCKNEIKKIIKKTGKKRGYGYWFWKPYIVFNELKIVNEGDIINYVDVGCHILSNKNEKFQLYLNTLQHKKKDIVAFQYNPLKKDKFKNINFPSMEEYKYTKSDLFDYFNFKSNNLTVKSPQFWAGCFFIKKSNFSINFLNEWLDVFKSSTNLIDDSFSKKNYEGFIENRHDQSVFSLLCKKNTNNIESFSAFELDWAYKYGQRTWDCTVDSPIVAKRDLRYGLIKRFLNRQIKNFKRINQFLRKNK